ncbi:hypothetical protein VIGAN_08289600 [Vigna angularis var. angularis]|uniref:Uncharacterized protein n=1 Tax=Vigna angularis var. angularis TaxID=157739 RepID=A0A0S3ST72_PHAAN|nr:hypothetical protein VIGAN_08289600 [Vigna angularis var. angularis]
MRRQQGFKLLHPPFQQRFVSFFLQYPWLLTVLHSTIGVTGNYSAEALWKRASPPLYLLTIYLIKELNMVLLSGPLLHEVLSFRKFTSIISPPSYVPTADVKGPSLPFSSPLHSTNHLFTSRTTKFLP